MFAGFHATTTAGARCRRAAGRAWARQKLTDLRRERDAAIRALRRAVDGQTPEHFRTESLESPATSGATPSWNPQPTPKKRKEPKP